MIFPKPPFILTIVAPRNSGKTLLTTRLVTTPAENGGYAKLFDEIYLFSPNIFVDPKLGWLATQLNPERVSLSFDTKKIGEILESSAINNSKHKLIICDDCMTEDEFLNQKSDGILNRIATIGRNRNVSLLVVLQKFKGAPKTFRQNIDGLVVFTGLSKPSLEDIYCAEIPFPFYEKKDFLDTYIHNTLEKFSFIIFNSQNNNSVYVYIPSNNTYKFLADTDTLKNSLVSNGGNDTNGITDSEKPRADSSTRIMGLDDTQSAQSDSGEKNISESGDTSGMAELEKLQI
jgi:hypothetical protein